MIVKVLRVSIYSIRTAIFLVLTDTHSVVSVPNEPNLILGSRVFDQSAFAGSDLQSSKDSRVSCAAAVERDLCNRQQNRVENHSGTGLVLFALLIDVNGQIMDQVPSC